MTRRTAIGMGVMLISYHKNAIPIGYSLIKLCTNNFAEYNELIAGLQIALQLGMKYLEAYGDSKLIVN